MQRKNIINETIIVISVFIVGVCIAMHFMHSNKTKPFFYQGMFAPAVMIACGHGFGIDKAGSVPALRKFLQLKTQHFSCDQLRPNTQLQTHVLAHAWYYMMYATGIVWAITGVSWPAVDYLLAILFAISLCVSYGLYRLGMGRVLAFIGVLLFALAYNHLSYLKDLRDYSKAPFLLAAIFIIAVMVVKQLSMRSLMLLALAIGVIAGLGYGFRPDALIIIPPAIVTILLFLPQNSWKKIPRNCLLVGIMLASFLVVAAPVFNTFKNKNTGSCQWHFATLGLATPFTKSLKLKPSLYDWGYQFDDAMVSVMVNTYGNRVMHLSSVGYCTHNYDLASGKEYLQIVKTFPADIIVRAYASIKKLLVERYRIFAKSHENSTRVHYHHLLNPDLVLMPILLLSVAAVSLRIAFFMLLGLLYFFGYPAVQFDLRHFFYLLCLYWWPIGFFISQGVKRFGYRQQRNDTVLKIRTFLQKPGIASIPLKRMALFAGVTVTLLIVPLWLARHYQQQQLSKIIHAYLSAPSKKLVYTTKMLANQHKLAYQFAWSQTVLPTTTTPDEQAEAAQMLKLTFAGSQCRGLQIPFTIKYHYHMLSFNFTRQLTATVPARGKPWTIYFVPVYFARGYAYPQSLILNADQKQCLTKIQIVNKENFYPLWLTLSVPSNWQQHKLYQRLS